jgi:hypothetical protein
MSEHPNLADKITAEANPSSSHKGCKGGPYSDSESGQRKRKSSADRVELSLQSLIPPQGKQLVSQESESKGCGSQSNDEVDTDRKVDWDAVVKRAMSHPHEARECYFKHGRPISETATDSIALGSSRSDSPIICYKSLHAACKYDPSLEAIEALLHAHPSAALDCTFEGTALKIAAENRSSMMVLRLLLVAELAMWKRLLEEKQRQTFQRESSNKTSGEEEEDARVEEMETSSLYHGKNPIHWICEPHVPVKTVGMLLTWYPYGAFKRPSVSDGAPFDLTVESPFIDIIDEFARDQDELEDDRDAIEDDVEDEYDKEASESDESMSPTMLRRTWTEKKRSRKERRWKKFLHIIQATDRVLNLTRPLPFTAAGGHSTQDLDPSLPNQASSTGHTKLVAGMNNVQTCLSHKSSSQPSEQRRSDSNDPRFRPVHAFIRSITNPKLGLELCRAYGVRSILGEMRLRIPEEFVGSFQILAESQAADCRLCHEEIKDIVEYLIDVDHKTAFAPRISDGRLLGHVALENGWPCKEVISHKKTATCA